MQGIELDIEKLKELPNTGLILYELLNGFGFTDMLAIEELLSAKVVSRSCRKRIDY